MPNLSNDDLIKARDSWSWTFEFISDFESISAFHVRISLTPRFSAVISRASHANRFSGFLPREEKPLKRLVMFCWYPAPS
jgi:hypothetical protein